MKKISEKDLYISPTTNKPFNEKKNIFFADFETIKLNQQHYVYAIGWIKKNDTNFKHVYLANSSDSIKTKSYSIMQEFIFSFYGKNNIIYFHNLGAFDGIFILDYLREFHIEDIKSDSVITRNNRIFKIKFRNLTFLDSMNIINNSLDKISFLLFKENKKPFDHDKIKLEGDIFTHKNEIMQYLYSDVYLLQKFMTVFIDKFRGLYNINIAINFTISSVAFKIYRSFYLNPFVIAKSKSFYDFVKKSYHGGLTNVLIPRIENGYYYDVNSLYPFIMKTEKMPVGVPTWENVDIINENLEIFDKYYGFVDCLMYVQDDLPIPPLSIKFNESLIQPTGLFRAVFFSEEIKFALTLNCKIKKIFKFLSFREGDKIFSKYVDDIYKKRIESDNPVDSLLNKTLLNSLYGRFAMSKEISTTLLPDPKYIEEYMLLFDIKSYQKDYKLIVIQIDQKKLKNMFDFYMSTDLQEDVKERFVKLYMDYASLYNKDMNLANHISSAISSYARIHLLKSMISHTKTGAEIYYYDTDSIITDKPMKEGLVSQTELGKFKLEQSIQEGYFLSPKTYALKLTNGNFIIKMKGFNNKSGEITFTHFKKFYYDGVFENIPVFKYIYKRLHLLKIVTLSTNFQASFLSNKYLKKYVGGIWSKTIPIKLDYDYINKKNVIYKTKL